ncbi:MULTISPECIES: OB-fold protein [Enterobacterales]|uniref:OB-fold protein n=1 Tax=Enterobacterales TaxID=91347 RepID=UPI00227CE1C0|nr:hypothetical protein [Citrobacter sp. W8]
MSKIISNKKCWTIFLVTLLISCFANAGPSIDTNTCIDKWSKLAKARDSEYKLTKQHFELWQKTFNTLSKVQSFGQLLQLPKTPESHDISLIPPSMMASYEIKETTPLTIASNKFAIEYFVKQKSKKLAGIKKLVDGNLYGYDGSLLGMVLSVPQASFMLYSEINPQNVAEELVSHPHKMQMLFDLIVSDEMQRILKNDTSNVIDSKLKKYSVSTIANTYEKNEVNGDLKYKGKQFIVDGVIKSVDSSFGDQPAVTFLTKNEYSIQDPVALFHNAESVIEKIAMLEKGEHLQLKCTGAGELAGSPILSECEFLNDYLKMKFLEKQRDEISAGYSVENTMPSIAAIVSTLPDDSGCFVGNIQKCKIDIFNVSNKEMRSASSRIGLTRDLVKNNIRVTIDEFNKKILRLSKDKKHTQAFIDFNESCFVPFIINTY